MRVAVGVGAAEKVPSSYVGTADDDGIVGFAVAVFDASAVCVKATEEDAEAEREDEPLTESEPHDVLDVLTVTETTGVGESDDETETVAEAAIVTDADEVREGDEDVEADEDTLVVTDTDRDVRGETDGEELCDGEFEAEVERLETRDADRAPDAVAHEGEEDADGDRLMEGEPEDVEETDVEGESVGDTDDVLDCVMIDADADAVE